MKFIEKDSSEKRCVSHLRLKALALQTDTFFNDFKKKDLVKLLKVYGRTVSMKSTKKILGQNLLQVLKDQSCINMANPDSLCPAISRPSNINEPAAAPVESTSVVVESTVMPIDEPVATTSVAVAEEALVEEPLPSTSASNIDESSAAAVAST